MERRLLIWRNGLIKDFKQQIVQRLVAAGVFHLSARQNSDSKFRADRFGQFYPFILANG